MPSVAALLSTYEQAESLDEAASALDQLEGAKLPEGVALGDLYDGLAEAAVESDDLDLAIRAQRRAIELGCEHIELAREMLAWYLLKGGRTEEGEAAFTALRRERPDDPQLLLTHANARLDSGDAQGSLEVFDAALATAYRVGDDDWVRQIRSERQYARFQFGLDPDKDDGLAIRDEGSDARKPGEVRITLAWFPRDQIDAAFVRWPSLAGDLEDPEAYCRAMEGTLRAMSAGTGRNPSVAPLRVERLIAFAGERGLRPDSGETRGQLAAELDRRGETIAWPPGRNESCWCGSGRKYKRCCGS